MVGIQIYSLVERNVHLYDLRNRPEPVKSARKIAPLPTPASTAATPQSTTAVQELMDVHPR